MKTNRHGIAVLDAVRTVRPQSRVDADETATVQFTPMCTTAGCGRTAIFVRGSGACCPDCLPAVLVREARGES